MSSYARYRAPAESGQKLISPPWSDLPAVAGAASRWRGAADVTIAGQSLAAFAASARRELLARAASYSASYGAGPPAAPGDADLPPAPTASAVPRARPLILTGHQPEMVHPGVWLKNFAAATLARSLGGVALNLVIDGDACRSTAIRIPVGTPQNPRFASMEFDRPDEKVPWEERTIIDPATWKSFADRVQLATASLLPERMLDTWWTTAVERSAAHGRIGASLAEARHLAEVAWGRHALELPQSAMCQTTAFRRFACHLFAAAPRLLEAYNLALADYRRAHGIRNHAQPVPNLVRHGEWVQAPFWVWSTADPRRRSVYVRRERTLTVLSDRRNFERALPLAEDADPAEAVAEIARWEAQGLKLRSRALVTTMFARLAVADLFIHGIGGAKYDEATDAISGRFFGAPPPPFAAISGTLRLPTAAVAAPAFNATELGVRLRELDFHPERYIDPQDAAAAAPHQAEKRRWIAAAKTRQNAAQRHAGIVAANQALQPLVAARRGELQSQLARAVEQARAMRILGSREYSFCLFPRDLLAQFLLDFPA